MDLPGEERIAELLQPYLAGVPLTPGMLASLRRYLELLLRWNAHTNLTAIREPEVLVQRQIGESLFAAAFLPATGSLLDFGSGAGFPGIPLQILRPSLAVTLAESQGKKASFLREAVRSLQLPCDVWPKRVEQMPQDRTFDVVTMRAVDGSAEMLPFAAARVNASGLLLRYIASTMSAELPGWIATTDAVITGSDGRLIRMTRSTA